jgi:hypothetical protein
MKIFIESKEELKPLAEKIDFFLRKNSGHRKALYKDNADFNIEIDQDWAGGKKGLAIFISTNDTHIIELGKTITKLFLENNIDAEYPKKSSKKIEANTLLIIAGRVNSEIDTDLWAELISLGIIKYFNPEYIEKGKNEKEPLKKRPQDKTYYDRSFKNNATNNSSLIFKKK